MKLVLGLALFVAGLADVTVHYRPFEWRLNAAASERPSE